MNPTGPALFRFAVPLLLAAFAVSAAAQQLYRWTDEKGRVHVTDTPPPASAARVEKKGSAAPSGPSAQLPFELTEATRTFPVTLYSAPSCKDACDQARALLNERGVPFTEVQVWDPQTQNQLKALAGEPAMVPTLTVGRSVQKGFQQEAYDALLDSARYPAAGVAPKRSQAAPPLPKDYVDPAQAKAKPVEPAAAAQAAPVGKYSPKPPAKPEPEAPRKYAPIPGKDAPLTGPYGKGADEPPATPSTPAQGGVPQSLQFPGQSTQLPRSQ